MDCTYRLSLSELTTRPAVELRLVGSDGDDDNDDNSGDQGNDEDGEDGQSGDSGDGGSDKDDKKGSGGKAAPDAKDRRIASLEEERQRHYDLRKEAETKLATAEARIRDLEKNGTTDEDTRTKLVNNEREIANLKTLNTDLALENKFLQSNKHKWKSATAALKLADLSKVEIDPKTGSVMGLDDALDALVAENPWLLEADENNDDKKDDDDPNKRPRRTGTPPADKDKKGDKSSQAVKARLQSKYAGLRR
jgi:hypothetical protein